MMIRKERRRTARTRSTVPLDLLDPNGRVLIGEGRFIDVSTIGSRVESKQPLQLRQTLFLQVQAPAKSPFEFAGRVIWRKKKAACFTYGIQFEALSKVRASTPHSGYKNVA